MTANLSAEFIARSKRETKKTWDVFASLGFALFCAQQLEDQLRETCGIPEPAVVEWPEYKITSTDTMGVLVGHVKKKFDDPDLHERLAEALRLRNYLAHHFFSSHRRIEMVSKKKQAMMNECGIAAVRFQVLTERLADQARRGVDTSP